MIFTYCDHSSSSSLCWAKSKHVHCLTSSHPQMLHCNCKLGRIFIWSKFKIKLISKVTVSLPLYHASGSFPLKDTSMTRTLGLPKHVSLDHLKIFSSPLFTLAQVPQYLLGYLKKRNYLVLLNLPLRAGNLWCYGKRILELYAYLRTQC